MKNHTVEFKFKVPQPHPEAGAEKTGSFNHDECENEQEAVSVMEAREWNIVDLVNNLIKANARASAYQAATLPYKESKVQPEQIRERMIRDFIRSGLTEDVARQTVDAALGQRV